MAHKVWLIFIIAGLHLIKMPLQCTSNLCLNEDFPMKPFHGSCRVEPGGTLCLSCPINKSTSYVVWTRNGETLFRGGHKVGKGNYKLSNCHFILESLEVSNVGTDQHHDEFTCSSNQTSSVTSKFIVEIEAQTALHIQEIKNGSFGNNTFLTTRSEIILKCVLEKAFGDVTITWAVNGSANRVSGQAYYYEDKLNGTYISIIRHRNNGGSDNVTCSSSGLYIRDTTVSWLYNASIPDTDANESPKTIIIAIALLVVFGGLVALHYFKKKYTKSSSKSLTVQGESSQISEDHLDTSKHQPVFYSQVARKKRGAKDLSENKVNVILQEQIQSTSKFIYWRGKWIKNQHEEKNCFVKTLNDEISLKNAFDFKRLAESLTALQAHENVVTVLSTFTDEDMAIYCNDTKDAAIKDLKQVCNVLSEPLPYSIYYEHMAFGTLRDILTAQYQQSGSSQIIDRTSPRHKEFRGQTEHLVSFSYDIAEAMTYITSKNFSHPALSASKVLLTENGRCKLYDIFPMEMAIIKIDEVMKKEFPPVAWLAPETIFLKDYSFASDMWNFAVVMWEIFSVGDIPYKGMTQSQVEQNIKQSVPLSQPPCCPGAIYSMMLSCWVTSRTERPTFENIMIQLSNIIMS